MNDTDVELVDKEGLQLLKLFSTCSKSWVHTWKILRKNKKDPNQLLEIKTTTPKNEKYREQT